MKDPRQEAYRAECAAVAGRGVSRLDWPKPYFLFISNLNSNITERLLQHELAKWCPPSKVTIPYLHGRSLGLAQVKLAHGVVPDRFLKELHQRDLHGQRISIVVDHEAKKYRQALKEANHQANLQFKNDASKRSPKKRMRAPDSPTYSLASPARPASDSDEPSPSNPKRPRGNSTTNSYQPHPTNRSQGGKTNETIRNHGERQFSYSRRDSYYNPQSYHRSNSRNFANDGPWDYSVRYHEHRDRQGSAHSYQYRNQTYHGDSRRHRYEGSGQHSHYVRGHGYGDRYDDHRRRDRKYGSGYRERCRSPRRYDTGYPRDYSYRGSNYPPRNAPMQTGTQQSLPHKNNGVREREWQNEYRPSIILRAAPNRIVRQDLLDAFRDFHPKNAITDGHGNWTMWFENDDDRNRAAAKDRFPLKGCMLQISTSSHLIGRRSVSTENPNSIRREARQPSENGTLAVSSSQDRHLVSGIELARGSDDQYWRRDIRRDMVRRDSRTEHRGSGQISSNRELNGKFKNRADVSDSSKGVQPETAPQESAAWERAGKYGANERRYSEGKNHPREHNYRESDQNGAKREQRDGPYGYHNRTFTSRKPDAGSTRIGSSEAVKKAGSGPLETVLSDEIRKTERKDKTVTANANLKDFAKAADAEPRKQASPGQKVDPKLTSKNLSVEDFADVLACYVYRKARDTITAKRSAVQKSLVNQTVVKFMNAKKAREKERTKRVARALLNNARKSPTKKEGSSSMAMKTAHLDLVATFLKPASQKQKKPPLPDRTVETPIRRRAKRSRFGDVPVLESEGRRAPDLLKKEDKDQQSSDDHPPQAVSKRRRLVLPNSPESSDSEHASADENRQNSVDSVASSELFPDKEIPSKHMKDGKKKLEVLPSSIDTVMSIEKPHIRQTKASSLKLSAPSMMEGSIPHLVLSARPPPSPVASGPPGSAFTTSEDNTSQEPSTPPQIANEVSQKRKSGGKTKKKAARGKGRQTKKQIEKTSDDEQYAGLLLSLNDSIKKTSNVAKIELLHECGFINVEDSVDETETLLSKRARSASKSTRPPSKVTRRPLQNSALEENEPDKIEKAVPEELDHGQIRSKVEEERKMREPARRVEKCARTDEYVHTEHTGQHRQRNVHYRTSISRQSSRECRQENRVYRKGVSRINPKNDIISFNHLKQRRKQVSFGQSMIHGMGLYAKENIDAGEFIIEYVGDLIRRVVADLREKKYARQGMGDSYLFRLSGDWVIDATRRGGIARFINHSCDPNVYAKIISVVGEPKIVFYSKRSIKEGEELTYDYKFDYEAEDQKIPCLCKAATCRKYLN